MGSSALRLLLPCVWLAASSLAFAQEEEKSAPVKEVSPGVYSIGPARLDQRTRTVTFPASVNMDLGALEYLLVTPSNHRAHHGRQPKYLDRNYGQTLIVFDQLFGTFQREQEAPSYGLVTPDPERNVLKFQVAGIRGLYAKIRSAPSFGARIGYLLRPPGWSHNGQHETAEALRARDAHRPGGTAQSAPGAAEVVVS